MTVFNSKTTTNYAKRRGMDVVLQDDGVLAFYDAREDMEPMFVYVAGDTGFFFRANVYLQDSIKEELPRWISTDADLRRVIDFVSREAGLSNPSPKADEEPSPSP